MNQNSLFGLDLEKEFFAPEPKIVLQHYRPVSDLRDVRFESAMRGKTDVTRTSSNAGFDPKQTSPSANLTPSNLSI